MPGRTKSRAAAAAAAAEQKPEDSVMDEAPPSAQKPAEDSQELQDDTVEEDGDEVEGEDEEEQPEPQRVRVLPGSTPTAASYEFLEEGHTLGNALRYIIMKNPEVEFCAYAIPHPSEAKMNIRIQTYDTTTADKALQKGLLDLEDLCDVVAEEFWAKRNEFVESEANKMTD